jgi:hydrogenase-4 membrane subunit HyfE
VKLPLVFLLILCITPLFFGRMRQLPGWLSFQALALAWYGLTDGPQGKAISMHDLLTAAEVVVLRAVLAPWLFSRMLARRNEPDLELMPSNLFTWGIAVSLIALAFEFAQGYIVRHGCVRARRGQHSCGHLAFAAVHQRHPTSPAGRIAVPGDCTGLI